MKRYPFPENPWTKTAAALFLAALLYLCRDSIFTTALLGFNKAYILTLSLTALVGILFLYHNRRQLAAVFRDGRMAVALLSALILLVPMVLKRDWQLMYASVLICLLIGVFLSYFLTLEQAAKYYCIILSVVGLYSVVATYLLRLLPDRGICSVPMFLNSIGVEFYHFGLSVVSLEYVKMRNFGLFREPGVYQFFVLLGLYLNNYRVLWKRAESLWLVNGILTLTMLSTFATGGIVELALLAGAVFFHKKLYRSKKVMVCILILAILAGIGLGVILLQKGELYWTLYGTFVYKFTEGADSSTERIDTLVENTRFFLRNPLAGGRIAAVFDTVPNNTSSTTLMFAIFGILGGLLHVASWVALVWDKKLGVWGNLFLLLIVFMAFNTQNLIADPFLWIFPVMALCQRGLPLLQQFRKKA